MKDKSKLDLNQLVIYLLAGLLILAAMQATQPIQQQAPGYNGNSWQTTIINEDNDTSICVGYCRDR